MEILGKIVKLRAIEEKDNRVLREMINDPYIESKTAGWSFPVSEIQQKNWSLNLGNNSNNLNLAIVLLDDEEDKCIGMANLVSIDWKNRSGFHGIKLHSETRGRGIAKDSVIAIMRYAFEELNLNRLDGSIIESNIPSKKLYVDKCGWKVEGLKKEAIFKNGRFQDNLILGITKKEYEEFLNVEKYFE